MVPASIPVDERTVELDEHVYTGLRDCYHNTLLKQTTPAARAKAKESLEVGATEGRAEYRADQVRRVMEDRDTGDVELGYRLLDFGCGNGSITRAVSTELGLGLGNCVGVDVVEHPGWKGKDEMCAFIKVGVGEALPFKDRSFDGAIALMSLHHVKDVKFVLNELSRVVKVGGRLMIREHDAVASDGSKGVGDREVQAFRLLIDVMHGLYCRVWPAVAESERFVDGYVGEYRSRGDWRELVEGVGVGEGGEGGVWGRRWGCFGLDGANVGRFYWDSWERVR
jgi:SAM-dependent methyltransferase